MALRADLALLFGTAIALGLPQASAAQQTFALPQGCTAYVSIQSRDCSVTHHFTCETDPEGFQRRVDFDQDGPVFFSVIDAETQWVESFSPRSGSTSRLTPGAADPASFSDLMASGEDTFDFLTTSDVFGGTRHVGADRLTGQVETIDGVVLQVTEFEAAAYDSGGGLLYSSTGQQYVNADWGTFLAGTEVTDNGEEVFTSDGRPMAFDFPGDPGFLSTQPIYGCDVVLSLLEVRP